MSTSDEVDRAPLEGQMLGALVTVRDCPACWEFWVNDNSLRNGPVAYNFVVMPDGHIWTTRGTRPTCEAQRKEQQRDEVRDIVARNMNGHGYQRPPSMNMLGIAFSPTQPRRTP